MIRPEAFDKDPLRILRAVRFAATLGFIIEKETETQIRRRSKKITEPSLERVRGELFLILAEKNAERHINLLDSLGLLAALLPEIEPLRGFAPGRYLVHDVLAHSIKTVGYLDNVLDDLPNISPEYAPDVLKHLEEQLEYQVLRKSALRFACLLHDIAKPETFTDTGGRISFHGHDNLGAEKATLICHRFMLSRSSVALVANVIKQHMRLFNLATAAGLSKNAMYRYCRDVRDELPKVCFLLKRMHVQHLK